MGLQLSAVGNHELDEGWGELYRMQKGGCHPVEGCQDGTGFAGAAFQFLSANIVLDPRRVDPSVLAASGWTPGTNRPATLFPPFAVKDVGGVKLGFIGLTLRRAPDLVLATGIKGLTFNAEAKTANAVARTLRRQGVRTIVVLIHEGGRPGDEDSGACRGMSGEILDIVRAMSRDIDVVISGHTHRAYTCTLGSKLVTSAERYGHAITDIDLRIDRRTGEVKSKTAHNVIVSRDIADPAAAALVARYRELAASLSLRRVGSLTASVTRDLNDAGESALGDLVADSMLDASAAPAAGGAVIALMNIGGLRENLVHAADERHRTVADYLRRRVQRPAVRQHAGGEDAQRRPAAPVARAAVRQPEAGCSRDASGLEGLFLCVRSVASRRSSRGSGLDHDRGAAGRAAHPLPGRHARLRVGRRRSLHRGDAGD